MKKVSVLMLVVMLMVTVLSACAAPVAAPAAAPAADEAAAAPAGDAALRDVTIGFSWNRKDSALQTAWEDYMKAYGAEVGPAAGLNINWVFNVADGDVARQTANIQDMINQGMDLIGARAEDAAAIGASAKAAADAGIPFITFDRASSGVQPSAHVGADSLTQAITTGEAFAELLKANNVVDPQCIEVLGDLKDQNAVLRSQGWQQVEAEVGAWKTVVQVPTEWNADKFYTGVANALQAHPEANCMFVASDFAFQGVEKALQEAGKLAATGEPNHMWMAAQDVNPPGLEALEKGIIDVVTSYDAYYHSVAFVDTAIKILNGETLDAAEFLVPGRVVTQDNFADMPNLWAQDYKGQ